jgi:hypothetical protein
VRACAAGNHSDCSNSRRFWCRIIAKENAAVTYALTRWIICQVFTVRSCSITCNLHYFHLSHLLSLFFNYLLILSRARRPHHAILVGYGDTTFAHEKTFAHKTFPQKYIFSDVHLPRKMKYNYLFDKKKVKLLFIVFFSSAKNSRFITIATLTAVLEYCRFTISTNKCTTYHACNVATNYRNA